MHFNLTIRFPPHAAEGPEPGRSASQRPCALPPRILCWRRHAARSPNAAVLSTDGARFAPRLGQPRHRKVRSCYGHFACSCARTPTSGRTLLPAADDRDDAVLPRTTAGAPRRLRPPSAASQARGRFRRASPEALAWRHTLDIAKGASTTAPSPTCTPAHLEGRSWSSRPSRNARTLDHSWCHARDPEMRHHGRDQAAPVRPVGRLTRRRRRGAFTCDIGS